VVVFGLYKDACRHPHEVDRLSVVGCM